MRESLSIEEIIKYEHEYGDIYKTVILNQPFYWREVTQQEVDRANRLFDDEEEKAEYICRVCVFMPATFDFSGCYAGITSTLSNTILEKSGYTDGHGKRMLGYYRQHMSKFENQIVPIICTAFPILRPDEVEEWTLNKQIYYLAMAEWILINLKNIPLEIGEQDTKPDYDAFPELRPK